ncbi:MAG TPA: hypothetical protein VFK14_12475 [Solirubrobacterales bacterium]|nr:hypothetical protein [Solirubrobacterales bacterium]
MANRFAPSDRGVYEVEPHGRLCPDPERPDGLLCSSATVLRRVRGGLDHPVLEALLRWEVEVRRLFDHRPGAADFCWAAEHVAAPGVAPRLLREYALCMPTPGEMEMLSSAERFPELVFGAEG